MSRQEIVAADRAARTGGRFGEQFWRAENLKFSEPWYRLEKVAHLVTLLAKEKDCALLDVGCGPATFMRVLPTNVRYHGIDIAVHEPAPFLIEADLQRTPIRFRDERFDIVVAQGIFEYLGDVQTRKFAEIAELLTTDGTFIVTYTNFGHRKAYVYEAFSNVQSLANFRKSLAQHFTIRRMIPGSHNWKHAQPNRRWLKAINMHLNWRIPFLSSIFAVDYVFVCSPLRP